MAETKLDFSKITFEDVLDPQPKVPLPGKKDEVVIPDKPEDAVDPIPPTDPPEGEVEGSLYENLHKLIGYEVEGEFDESVEGIAEYTKAIGQKIAEEEVRDLFEAFPDVKEYLQFRLNNGDPAKFFEAKYGDVDYSKYTVSETDETTQEVIVRKYLSLQGFNDEAINETVKDYKDTGLLYKSAKKYAERLIETQRSRSSEITARQAEEARQLEMQREQVVSEISNTIEKGTLHNIVIPEKDRKEFRAWLLQPDAKGQTRRQATMGKLTLEQKLELEYLAFKGFDLKDLVKKEATKTRIEFLKNQTGSKTSRLGGVGVTKTTPKTALEGLKLNDIL